MANINLGKVALTPKGVWNINNTYEKLDIVSSNNKHKVYIAIRNVPTGINITNNKYWENLIDIT